MLLQQLKALLPNTGSVNGLILNFNVDLAPVALGWLSFGVRISLSKCCPGKVPVPLTPAFWIPAQRQPGAHTSPFGPSRGSCHLATTQSSHAITGATRQAGPPPKATPAPAQPWRGCGADTQEPAGSWVSISLQGSGERARPRPRPPHSWAHTRAHTPARARRHTRAHAHRSRARDCRVGYSPAWSGAHRRSPRGRRRPPRPAPPLEPAERGALRAAKFRCASPLGRRVGSGLARLHGAPDGRDRWPGARAVRTDLSARLPPGSTPRISAPRALRALLPQGRSAASRAPARSFLLPGFDPSPPPPTMARGPARTTQLLPLLPLLLLLLRDAGGSHQAPARSAPPAAADGLAGIKDPWRFPGDAAATLGPGAQDMVAAHMLRLYEKYSRRGARPGGGNTVRSFRARLGK